MVAFALKNFGGEIPKLESRMLPDNMAEVAWNCDLSGGVLTGLPVPELVRDFSFWPTPVERAYRLPGPNPGDPDAWLPLESAFASVVRSPLANDTLHRIYWTDVPGTGAFWNTYSRILAGNTGGNAPYNLGFTAPDPAVVPSVSAVGGTAGVPLVERAYLYTFLDQYGLESSPSPPSAVVSGEPDATWNISGLPTTAPSAPAGKHYPNVIGMKIYRTISGTAANALYYYVGTMSFPTAGTLADTLPDYYVVNNNVLESESWLPPPDGLDGLTALPGGMLVGWTGNTLHFCEPDRPHAWPAGYDISVNYDIVALGVWQSSLVVLTTGYPSNGTGTHPNNFSLQQVQVPEPCIARGSVLTDLLGVYYASQNGIVMLNWYGMQNQTLQFVTKNIWLNEYQAANIIACRHRAQYLAINGTGLGFMIDYTEQRLGIVHLNTFVGAVAIWNDPYTGDAYICSDKKIYLWDSPRMSPLPYRWRSKQFYLPKPTSLGACQISMSPDVEAPPRVITPPLVAHDPALDLPDGANCLFRLYVGDGHLVMQEVIDQARDVFRLPSGFMAFGWQIEVVSRVPIFSIELASTMKELKSV